MSPEMVFGDSRQIYAGKGVDGPVEGRTSYVVPGLIGFDCMEIDLASLMDALKLTWLLEQLAQLS